MSGQLSRNSTSLPYEPMAASETAGAMAAWKTPPVVRELWAVVSEMVAMEDVNFGDVQ